MIKKLGFFDILHVLKADMPDFSVQRPDNLANHLNSWSDYWYVWIYLDIIATKLLLFQKILIQLMD